MHSDSWLPVCPPPSLPLYLPPPPYMPSFLSSLLLSYSLSSPFPPFSILRFPHFPFLSISVCLYLLFSPTLYFALLVSLLCSPFFLSFTHYPIYSFSSPFLHSSSFIFLASYTYSSPDSTPSFPLLIHGATPLHLSNIHYLAKVYALDNGKHIIYTKN